MTLDSISEFVSSQVYDGGGTGSEGMEQWTQNGFAIIRYTVDFFTDIQYRMGKQEFSALLDELATAIEGDCVDKERILKRYPNAFDVLLYNLGRNEVDQRVDRWSYFWEKILKRHLISYTISFSAGVCEAKENDIFFQLKEYVDKARFALRFGRINRNPFVRYFSEEDYQRLHRQRFLEVQIGSALNDRQLQVYFQPQYRLSNQKIIGAEALVRWNHPTLGLIMPDEFIPLFEQNHFILQLDFYVLEECCKLLHQWEITGFPVMPISVNFSKLHVNSKDFLQKFCTVIKRYEVDPKNICLEWTETAYSKENVRIDSIAAELRARGVQISMDDFGTGYSSLVALTNLPVDIIKLDKQFLDFTKGDSRHEYLLDQIIRTAHKLGFVIIAEGIEYPWQAELIRGMGCEYAQGFLYSRPVPLSTYEKLLYDYCAQP